MPIDTPAWVRDAVFYQIFPDRFARSGRIEAGVPLEAWNAPPTPYGFKGGDLFGVTQKLDELAELGINALYFCPIFASAANHRYHTYDYFNVDPLLGGNDALKELLEEAHQRNIKVVLDGVFNHASRGFWQFHHVMENGAASPYRDWFHYEPTRMAGQRGFEPYPSPPAQEELNNGAGSYDAIGYAAWWNLPALPKFNTDCKEVRDFLLDVATYWIDFGIDGWRLDVPNEIEDDEFWREFRRRVRSLNPQAYIVGEVWGPAERWLQGDMWDAVMNYQITAACLGFFGGQHLDLEETRRPSSFKHVDRMKAADFIQEVERVGEMYAAEVVQSQLNLLDSHDMPRFITCCNENEASLRLAWLFLCLLPGAPCVYYGDEVGLTGRQDPDCRKGFPTEKSDWNTELRQWYQRCIQLRHNHESLRTNRPQLQPLNDSVLQVTSADERVFAVLNTGDESVEFTLPNGSWIDWNGQAAEGNSTNTCPPQSARVFTS